MDWIVRKVERRTAGNSVVNKEKHEAGVLSAHIIFGSVPMRGSGCRIQQHPVVLHNLLLFLLFFLLLLLFQEINLHSFPHFNEHSWIRRARGTEGEQIAHDS